MCVGFRDELVAAVREIVGENSMIIDKPVALRVRAHGMLAGRRLSLPDLNGDGAEPSPAAQAVDWFKLQQVHRAREYMSGCIGPTTSHLLRGCTELSARIQADKDAAADQRALYHDPRCTSPQLSPTSRQRADTFEELYSILSPDSRNRTDSDARFDNLMRTSESEVGNDTISAVSPITPPYSKVVADD